MRIIPGHGKEMQRLPAVSPGAWSSLWRSWSAAWWSWSSGLSSRPSSSTTTGRTPKNGSVAEPGFCAMAPGSGAIRIPPVYVCHHVSTIGQRPSPTTRWYQRHTSGLIGSPTVPSSRSDFRLRFFTGFSPCCIRARIAVGAV